MSPTQLVFGISITLDTGIFLSPKKEKSESSVGGDKDMSEWAENMLKKQAEIMQIANSNRLLSH